MDKRHLVLFPFIYFFSSKGWTVFLALPSDPLAIEAESTSARSVRCVGKTGSLWLGL